MKPDDASISTDGELRTLGVEDIPQCVHVMAQAFADSPAYKVCEGLVVGGEESRCCFEYGVTVLPNQLSSTFASGFSSFPPQFIFQGEHAYRMHALEWLFESNLHLMLSKSPSCLKGIVNPNGQVICCFMWGESSSLTND